MKQIIMSRIMVLEHTEIPQRYNGLLCKPLFKKWWNFIVSIIFIFILIGTASAEEVIITKETSQNIKLNDIIEIKINVLNPYAGEKAFQISERLPNGVELIEPAQPDEVKHFNGIEVRYLNWNLLISANKISTISYKIKIKELGDYSIQATDVTDTSNNELYFSNSLEFSINCNPNSECEENENYFNCPEDCGQSASDGICNYASDSICDLDCETDPDCAKSKLSLVSIIAMPLALALIIFVLYLLIKRKNANNIPPQQSI